MRLYSESKMQIRMDFLYDKMRLCPQNKNKQMREINHKSLKSQVTKELNKFEQDCGRWNLRMIYV